MNFQYIASDMRTGRRIKGDASASSVSSLVRRLKREDLLPLKVYENKQSQLRKKMKTSRSRKLVSMKELAVFTRQLAATLSAGLLLTESLETIAADLENVQFSRIIRDIRANIQSGSDFSNALAKYPNVFPATYVALVKSGEAAGNLDSTMSNLAKYLEDSESMKEKVKNAIRYPLFVIGFAVFVVLIIVLFIIPKFRGLFTQAGVELPFLTRIVVGISEFTLHSFSVIVLGLVLAYFLFRLVLKLPGTRYWLDALALKIPFVGKDILHKALVSRFCRTFGFLFAGGVSLSRSLEITSQVVDHSLMGKAISQIRKRVMSGSSLSEEIKKQEIFPRLTAKMASVGEKTGKISEMLTRVSDYYDEELNNSFQRLTTLLEPVLIIFVGGIVLFVVIALYLPIFQMSAAIK